MPAFEIIFIKTENVKRKNKKKKSVVQALS